MDREHVHHVVLFVRPQHEPTCHSAKPAARMRERIVGRWVEDFGLRCHDSTLALQAGLKSNEEMELVTIGDAAEMLALNASALRYYE
ncbi:MAG TPA: hypothetical protein VHJ79_03205, partial [Mycobacterium sp.]|nr:hypothetical protein [Mycobacterium sp.]